MLKSQTYPELRRSPSYALTTSLPGTYPEADFPSAWLQTEGESIMGCLKGPPYAKSKPDKEFMCGKPVF